MCLLFVSHNLALVRQLCEARVLVLYLGRMMELAPSPGLYTGAAASLHPRAARCGSPNPRPRTFSPRAPGARARPRRAALTPVAARAGCVYRTRCPYAAPVCAHSVFPSGKQLPDGRRVACHPLARSWPVSDSGTCCYSSPMMTEAAIRPSDSLKHVRYEIRGRPRAGVPTSSSARATRSFSLNIGNPRAFGLRTPEDHAARHDREPAGGPKGTATRRAIFPAREAVVMQQAGPRHHRRHRRGMSSSAKRA